MFEISSSETKLLKISLKLLVWLLNTSNSNSVLSSLILATFVPITLEFDEKSHVFMFLLNNELKNTLSKLETLETFHLFPSVANDLLNWEE